MEKGNEKRIDFSKWIIVDSKNSKEFLASSNSNKLLFADLHIHSKYSRACSKDLNFENLVKWAKIKGLNLLGTGDFTHPLWLKEIENLKEDEGIYYLDDFPFILSSEISLIYTKNNKGRRVHLVYLAPNLETVYKINSWLDTKGRRDYDGRPIFGISCRDFTAKIEEIDNRIEVIPAHSFTPWFGIFGSEGGFDKLKDAFEDKTYLIHAIETGISADAEMCWKIHELDEKAIVSFSDCHSFWPWRLGREATIFYSPENNEKLTYDFIIKQIREKSFFGTIEAEPAYGKYHFDGHRNCNFSCSSEETKKLNGICPVCNKGLTVGVEYRVNELSKLGIANHKDKKFYYKILPLHEIISLALELGVNSKGVWKIYNLLIDKFENEFNILLNVDYDELYNITGNKLLSELIIKNREGKIEVVPGFDGIYGKAVIDGKEVGLEEDAGVKNEVVKKEKETQKKLF